MPECARRGTECRRREACAPRQGEEIDAKQTLVAVCEEHKECQGRESEQGQVDRNPSLMQSPDGPNCRESPHRDAEDARRLGGQQRGGSELCNGRRGGPQIAEEVPDGCGKAVGIVHVVEVRRQVPDCDCQHRHDEPPWPYESDDGEHAKLDRDDIRGELVYERQHPIGG